MAVDVSPRFTVSLRGYDKDEVEHYLESVTERTTQADEQLYELQEQARFLEDEHDRLLGRVDELESAIRSETPHSVSALGERITLILNEAEEGASDTLTQARATAEYLVGEAQKEADALQRQAAISATEAMETLTNAQRQAEQLAERLEAEARARAAAVLGDAELRAQRRQEQIEGWAQEVITRTQSEQARLVDEFAMIRRRHDAEVRGLLGERDDAVAALRSLQTAIGRAVDRLPSTRLSRSAPDGTGSVASARVVMADGAVPHAPAPLSAGPLAPTSPAATPSNADAGSSTGGAGGNGMVVVTHEARPPFAGNGSGSYGRTVLGKPNGDSRTFGSGSGVAPVDADAVDVRHGGSGAHFSSAPVTPPASGSDARTGSDVASGFDPASGADARTGSEAKTGSDAPSGSGSASGSVTSSPETAGTSGDVIEGGPAADAASGPVSEDSAPTGPTPVVSGSTRSAADSFYDVEADIRDAADTDGSDGSAAQTD